MTQRLSLSTLAQVPSGVARPSYDVAGDDLLRDPRFVSAVREALSLLFARGAAQAVEEVARRGG